MLLEKCCTIIDAPSGALFKKNNESENSILQVSMVSISNNTLNKELLNITEVLQNRIVNVKNTPFIVMEKIGKNAGLSFYVDEKHGITNIIPSNHSLIILINENEIKKCNLSIIAMQLKYLYNNSVLKSCVNKNTTDTLSIKRLKKIQINIEMNEQQKSILLDIDKNIRINQSKVELLHSRFQFTKEKLLSGEYELNGDSVSLSKQSKSRIKSTSAKLLKFNTGKVFTSKDNNVNGNINLISISDLKQTYNKDTKKILISDTDLKKIKNKEQYVQKNEILIALSHQLGAVSKGHEGIYSNHLFKVRSKSDKVLLNEYLYYLLQSNDIQKQIERLSTGLVAKSSYDSKTNLKFELPIIKEQKYISKLLQTLEGEIEDVNIYIEKMNIVKNYILKNFLK